MRNSTNYIAIFTVTLSSATFTLIGSPFDSVFVFSWIIYFLSIVFIVIYALRIENPLLRFKHDDASVNIKQLFEFDVETVTFSKNVEDFYFDISKEIYRPVCIANVCIILLEPKTSKCSKRNKIRIENPSKEKQMSRFEGNILHV